MPICKYARSSGSRCFKGEAGYSYCAAKDEKYYGFEGHILISFKGIICGYTFTAANVDERDVLPEIVAGLQGLLIGDKGYIRKVLAHTMGCFLGRMLGNPTLLFEQLVEV